MATTDTDLTSTWTTVGSAAVPFTPRGNDAEVFFTTGSSSPAATAIGHTVKKDELVTISPSTGEWGWVRNLKRIQDTRSVVG